MSSYGRRDTPSLNRGIAQSNDSVPMDAWVFIADRITNATGLLASIPRTVDNEEQVVEAIVSSAIMSERLV